MYLFHSSRLTCATSGASSAHMSGSRFSGKNGRNSGKIRQKREEYSRKREEYSPSYPQEEEEILSLTRKQLAQLQAKETAAKAERRAATSAGGGGSEPVRNTPELLLNLEQCTSPKKRS